MCQERGQDGDADKMMSVLEIQDLPHECLKGIARALQGGSQEWPSGLFQNQERLLFWTPPFGVELISFGGPDFENENIERPFRRFGNLCGKQHHET